MWKGLRSHSATPILAPGLVSVINTASNTVVATVTVGVDPFGVAVTPDGTHAYVTNLSSNTVSVIDTATNTVEAAAVAVGTEPIAVAVTPDGKHAYVANLSSNNVSVIDTVANTVVATVPVAVGPIGVAVTPDGKHAYVANEGTGNVSVIDTATNTVEAATIMVGTGPYVVAITPDGKYAYVTNNRSNNVSVIDTATNTVLTGTGFPIPVGSNPIGVAITPDGKHAYVANEGPGNVSVIDTATNTVVATVPVKIGPIGVGIIPPPPGVPFLGFSATTLGISFGAAPNEDSFNLHALVTLSSTSIKGINPLTQPVTLQVGTFTTTIPSGSFTKLGDGSFTFTGVINGVSLEVQIKQAVTLRYFFNAGATGASLTGTKNPGVYVTLTIGPDSGAASVTAQIQGQASSRL
jgi:YVTN family beta-propeller protein